MVHLEIRNESARKRVYRRDVLARIAERVCAAEYPGHEHLEVSVLFCDDDFIGQLNRQYRHKQGATDVLIFFAKRNGVSRCARARRYRDFAGDRRTLLWRRPGGDAGRGAALVLSRIVAFAGLYPRHAKQTGRDDRKTGLISKNQSRGRVAESAGRSGQGFPARRSIAGGGRGP